MTADGAQTAATPKPFSPYGVELSSRLLLGTARYSSPQVMSDAVRASGAEVTRKLDPSCSKSID